MTTAWSLYYLTIPTHTLSERHHDCFVFTNQARERLAFDHFETAEALVEGPPSEGSYSRQTTSLDAP